MQGYSNDANTPLLALTLIARIRPFTNIEGGSEYNSHMYMSHFLFDILTTLWWADQQWNNCKDTYNTDLAALLVIRQIESNSTVSQIAGYERNKQKVV